MKYLTVILTIIAIGLIFFNATKLNFNNLLKGESIIALITIIASCCAILLLQILRLSKRIEREAKRKK